MIDGSPTDKPDSRGRRKEIPPEVVLRRKAVDRSSITPDNIFTLGTRRILRPLAPSIAPSGTHMQVTETSSQGLVESGTGALAQSLGSASLSDLRRQCHRAHRTQIVDVESPFTEANDTCTFRRFLFRTLISLYTYVAKSACASTQ